MLFVPQQERMAARRLYVFCLFWLVTFILYLPAAKAGFVSDTTGWMESLQRDSFYDYINRTRFGVKSMYQVTQLNTWLLFQLFGKHAWAWHLLYITLHAGNCLLLFLLSRNLFRDTHIPQPSIPALAGAFLFCISPYNSEVVVWEASFHYLQALLFILGILLLVQRFQQQPTTKWAIGAAVLFFLSTFTHELFYLTPLLVLALAIYYRYGLGKDKAIFRKTLLYFSFPQLLLFGLHLLLLRVMYHNGIAHVGNHIFNHPLPYFLVKPPWYFFHLLTWGRFFPDEYRQAVYGIFRTPAGSIGFYMILAVLTGYILFRFRRMGPYGKLVSLYFIWMLLALALFVPMWFPEKLLVICDRYLYLMLVFYSMLLALILYRIPQVRLRQCLFIIIAGINLCLTLSLSFKWGQSATLIRSIQSSTILPSGSGKVTVLLNSPACMQGIPMIGTSPAGEFRLMHNLFYTPTIKDTMLEAAAYNMESTRDGAHIRVINDSTVKVTLNQQNTWWWVGSVEATSYETSWFRVEMTDPGHWYNLILQQPAVHYRLLYQQGNTLKEVDMRLKGNDQY